MAETLASEQFGIARHDAVEGECELFRCKIAPESDECQNGYIIYTPPAHYDRIAEKYDEYMFYWYEPIAQLVARHLDLKPDDRVADIGGGTGGVAHRLWKIAGQKRARAYCERGGMRIICCVCVCEDAQSSTRSHISLS